MIEGVRTGDVILVLLIVLCAGAALQDARQYKISNIWPLLITVLGALALFTMPSGLALSHLTSFAIVLVVGMVLFSLGWFGGGDAKMVAAVALHFPLPSVPLLLLCIAAAGGVLAVVALVRPGSIADRRRRRIAYGVPIAAGTIGAALLGMAF